MSAEVLSGRRSSLPSLDKLRERITHNLVEDNERQQRSFVKALCQQLSDRLIDPTTGDILPNSLQSLVAVAETLLDKSAALYTENFLSHSFLHHSLRVGAPKGSELEKHINKAESAYHCYKEAARNIRDRQDNDTTMDTKHNAEITYKALEKSLRKKYGVYVHYHHGKIRFHTIYTMLEGSEISVAPWVVYKVQKYNLAKSQQKESMQEQLPVDVAKTQQKLAALTNSDLVRFRYTSKHNSSKNGFMEREFSQEVDRYMQRVLQPLLHCSSQCIENMKAPVLIASVLLPPKAKEAGDLKSCQLIAPGGKQMKLVNGQNMYVEIDRFRKVRLYALFFSHHDLKDYYISVQLADEIIRLPLAKAESYYYNDYIPAGTQPTTLLLLCKSYDLLQHIYFVSQKIKELKKLIPKSGILDKDGPSINWRTAKEQEGTEGNSAAVSPISPRLSLSAMFTKFSSSGSGGGESSTSEESDARRLKLKLDEILGGVAELNSVVSQVRELFGKLHSHYEDTIQRELKEYLSSQQQAAVTDISQALTKNAKSPVNVESNLALAIQKQLINKELHGNYAEPGETDSLLLRQAHDIAKQLIEQDKCENARGLIKVRCSINRIGRFSSEVSNTIRLIFNRALESDEVSMGAQLSPRRATRQPVPQAARVRSSPTRTTARRSKRLSIHGESLSASEGSRRHRGKGRSVSSGFS